MLSEPSTPARHFRSAFVFKVLRRMLSQSAPQRDILDSIRLKVFLRMNAEPAQHPSATFQIGIRLIRVMANAEPAQHSIATF
ncbi:hypothetical protein DPMN_032176 [Dreissena polymorpha]|uniref:Uncharacterized protein n=1 Tax=Dreissena polymorpha TaxID=45954 RepID=A0A9D4M396_DREPO|nr:hypothetical protein DPMN_032176 [Dreissena polymorpha]